MNNNINKRQKSILKEIEWLCVFGGGGEFEYFFWGGGVEKGQRRRKGSDWGIL